MHKYKWMKFKINQICRYICPTVYNNRNVLYVFLLLIIAYFFLQISGFFCLENQITRLHTNKILLAQLKVPEFVCFLFLAQSKPNTLVHRF